VPDCGLAFYIKKYVKGKRRIMKIQICISLSKKYNLQINLLKKQKKSSKLCKGLFSKHTAYSENIHRY
jgi:hypothetical protein